MSHHANDGSASRTLRGLLAKHGYHNDDLGRLLGAVAAQRERCAQGEHNETTAQPRYVTYVRGRQVKPGTRYCRFCSKML